MRQAALGDVQLRHDLEAGDDRQLQLDGRLHHLVEHAVHAVAVAEVRLVRLDVDVGGALLDRVQQDEVDQLDHGRVGGALLQVAEVGDAALVMLDGDVALVEPLHHLFVGGALLRVVLLQRLLDGLLAGDDDLDVVAGEELDVVDGVDVGGVAHRQDQRGAGAVDRNALVLLGDFLGDEFHHLAVDVEFFQVDGRNAVLLRKKIGELGLFDEAELREVVTDPAAGLLLLVLRLLQLLQRDEVFADQ